MTRKAVLLDGLDIELRTFTDLDFAPTDVVVGISSEGTVGPLVASHLIQQLGMDQVCALESPMFPPTSMVYFERPKYPARIYASNPHKLAVVLAEFAPMDELARPLAYSILHWCEAQKAGRVIGIDSFAASLANPAGVGLAAIGSMDKDRKAILKARVSSVQHGAVTGVAGVLLNEGRWRRRPTIVLMASLGAGPDEDAAVHVLAAIQKLVPRLRLRAPPQHEPTQLEKAIRAAHERTVTREYI